MEARDCVTISERMSYVREKIYGKRGKAKFARALGIPLTTYVEYEKTREPPVHIVEKVCRVTGARVQWLISGEGEPWGAAGPSPAEPAGWVVAEGERGAYMRETRPRAGEDLTGVTGANFDEFRPEVTTELPLMGTIVAGLPTQAEEWDCIQFARVLAHQGKPNRYVLRVRGESMMPDLKPEDLVLIENRDAIEPEDVLGRICAVCLNGQTTLKRVVRNPTAGSGTGVSLVSMNPAMSPIEVQPGDDFRILGVAVEVVSRKL